MLAIIGGTGLYKLDGLDIVDEIELETPFGAPSSTITKAQYQQHTLLFLPRHGAHHQLLPHEINYRANIYALKSLGARQVLGFSAKGSLREDIHPGEFAIPAQYLDFVRGPRIKTFFGEGVAAHVSMAIPTCPDLTKWVKDQAEQMDIPLHTGKTSACVDGPRLGTVAESHFLRSAGADLVGMTNVPEVFLAREAQLCYATISIVTDYDCWMDDPKHHVSVAEVINRYGASMQKAQALLMALLSSAIPTPKTDYRETLKMSLLTPPEAIPKAKRAVMDVLRA